MRDSIRLGKISGISIGLHWSIALIAGLFTLTLANTVLPAAAPGSATIAYVAVAVLTSMALLASIVAHELGHSIVAKNNGIGIAGITLFALGGVAKLESEPDDPSVASRIALAGPAVSVAIGVVSLAIGATAGAFGLPALLAAGITWLGIINLAMAVFNMLPALPLDGGRALQAFLWKRTGNRHQATIRAAGLGRYVGWGIVAFGLWQFFSGGSGLFTALIGWFIVTSARAESMRAKLQIQRDRVGHSGWPFGPGRNPFGPAPHAGAPHTGAPHTGAQHAGAPQGWAPHSWAPPSGPPSHGQQVLDVEGRLVD